jgi:cyclic pyranopterin phosphate synthase
MMVIVMATMMMSTTAMFAPMPWMMRLTADGKMKNCLFSTSETDLLTPFRQGMDIVPLIYQSIRDKKQALGGQFTTDLEKIETSRLENRSMITIGG